MIKAPKQFKSPPRKYHPKGIKILYEDHDILVVNKTSGLLTIASDKEQLKTAYFLLNDYVRKGNSKSKNRVFIVHRLDRDASGVLIFAKTELVKRFLQTQWDSFKKTYYILVKGSLVHKEGLIESYLAENLAHKMYSVKDETKGKLAQTGYKVVQEKQGYSLIDVDLITGKKNQIRVHFAEKGHPVLGDKKYGSKDKGVNRLTLHSQSLEILHPHTKEKMVFKTNIPEYFKEIMNRQEDER